MGEPRPLVEHPLWRVAGSIVVPNGVAVPGFRALSPVVVGRRARLWGPLRSSASIALSAQTVVLGEVRAGGDVIVGARSEVLGGIHAEGTVLVQRGARVQGSIRALKTVTLCDEATVGEVHSKADIRVIGRVAAARLHARGRTVML